MNKKKAQTKKRRGLGSLGVDALLTTRVDTETNTEHGEQILHIKPDQIQPSRYQPRKNMDEDSLRELAESIKHQGLLQPIVLRILDDTDGHYELIAGERRWRAAQLASIKKIPAILKKVDENTAAAIALVENIQRDDLSAIEEAMAIKQLLLKFDMTHEQVATAIGRSRTAVTNSLRLLELAPEVRDWLAEGRLEMAHARTLLPLDKTQQTNTARLIIGRDMSVREVEEYVRKLLNKKKKKKTSRKKKTRDDADIKQLELHLSEKLGTPVKVKYSKKTGNGSLVIYYNSLDGLDAILDKTDLI